MAEEEQESRSNKRERSASDEAVEAGEPPSKQSKSSSDESKTGASTAAERIQEKVKDEKGGEENEDIPRDVPTTPRETKKDMVVVPASDVEQIPAITLQNEIGVVKEEQVVESFTIDRTGADNEVDVSLTVAEARGEAKASSASSETPLASQEIRSGSDTSMVTSQEASFISPSLAVQAPPTLAPSAIESSIAQAREAAPAGFASLAAPSSMDPASQDHLINPEQVIEENGELASMHVGRVIGKGGEMIRDLQARSGARIDVDQNVPANMPRVITYRGTRQTIDFAKHLVQLLVDGVNEADLPLGEARREVLVIPSQAVGKVIGRGGEMIRELQSRSQSKIQVDHSGMSGMGTDKKQVTITGTEQGVIKAKEMVLFLVANPMMDAMQSLNMLVDDKLRGGGQWGSGPPYYNLPNQGVNMQPGMMPVPAGGALGYDLGYQQGYAAPMPYGGISPHQQTYQQSPPQVYGSSVDAFGGAGAGSGAETMYAAKQFMGRVIGQKGITINDLQKRSGTDIQINQDVPPGHDCEITIKGSSQGIAMAKQMIQQIIEVGPQHPFAGGAGSDYGGYNQAYSGYGQAYGYQPPYDQGASMDLSYGQQGFVAGGQPYAGTYGQQPGYDPYQSAAPAVAPLMVEWKSAQTPEGQTYYYNERTGVTTWQKPAGFP